MKDLILELKTNTLRAINSSQDLLVTLCSLNLMNSLIKNKSYKPLIDYKDIKPKVIRTIRHCYTDDKLAYADEIIYSKSESCVYIRCFGIQFSFHNVNGSHLNHLLEAISVDKAKWDGVRLQPIALQLYDLSKKVWADRTLKYEVVQEEFRRLVGLEEEGVSKKDC